MNFKKLIALHYKANPTDEELEILDLMQDNKQLKNELMDLKEAVNSYLAGDIKVETLRIYLK